MPSLLAAAPGTRITVAQVRALARRVLARCGDGLRPADRALRAELEVIDREGAFTAAAMREFQALLARVGVATCRPIAVPLDDRPYWHRAGQSFAGFRSRPSLPESADVVVIGAGTLLFAEGDPGGTCYVVLAGTVDVSVKVLGQAQLLAQLGPGSIFGQASLVDGTPHAASCSVRHDAVLAAIDRKACERLLEDQSAVALKLLGALNQGLIAALREADRRLMRLELQHETRGGAGVDRALRSAVLAQASPEEPIAATTLEHRVPLASI